MAEASMGRVVLRIIASAWLISSEEVVVGASVGVDEGSLG
jgi:hypothetical protein